MSASKKLIEVRWTDKAVLGRKCFYSVLALCPRSAQSMVARPGGSGACTSSNALICRLSFLDTGRLAPAPITNRATRTHFPLGSCTNATLHYRWESQLYRSGCGGSGQNDGSCSCRFFKPLASAGHVSSGV